MSEAPPANSAQSLDALRQRVDQLDEQIVKLLNARANVVVEIGKLKQQCGEPTYAPDREKVVLDRLRALNNGPLPDRSLEAVYREVMSGSFALERPLRIGYLGPAGSFSHTAATRKFGRSVQYIPVSDIASVVGEVQRGHVDYGLVPVENSTQGGIIETLDAFLTMSGARVCAEVLFAVHHNLLAQVPWERVTRIASKPEVFDQCRNWLASTAKEKSIEPAPSTSRAAEIASAEEGVAAIGSRLAGELYGLQVLFENIEDNPDNITRFFVIGKEPARKTGRDKTAIMFRTGHTPGALAEVLNVFQENQINLTDIEKRPSRRQNWEYYFFVDAEGHHDDPSMRSALEAARAHCLQLVVLGSYPAAEAVV